MSAPVTLKHVASAAGVSVQTVSQILNGRNRRYHPDTQRRVEQLARELNYRPNALGRALRGGRSMSIGLITKGLVTPTEAFHVRTTSCIARDAGFLTYILTLEHPGDDSEAFVQAAREMIERRVDGLIVMRSMPLSPEAQAFIKAQSLPVVFMDWAPTGWSARLILERDPSTRAVLQHLAQLGHQHVVMISSIRTWDYPDLRILPYRRAAAELGVDLIADPRFSLDPEADVYDQSKLVVTRLLQAGTPATALIAHTDEVGVGAISAIREAGLSVPDDISVVGYDDHGCGRVCDPPLTTVRTPREEMGQHAFRILQQMINTPVAPVEPVQLSFEFIPRQSTGPAPSMSTAGSKRSVQSSNSDL